MDKHERLLECLWTAARHLPRGEARTHIVELVRYHLRWWDRTFKAPSSVEIDQVETLVLEALEASNG